MKILSQIGNLIIITSFAASAWAELPKITISSSGNVYLYDNFKGDRNIFISNTANILRKPFGVSVNEDDCFWGSPSIDPLETKIAFSGNCKFPKDGDFSKNREGYYRLKILDITTKKPLVTIKYAYRFSFSPRGDAILYINDYPGSSERESPPLLLDFESGIYLYSFNSKTKTKLSSPVGACDFNWSSHDGKIYFTDSNQHVFRYDVSKGQGSLVPYKGIYFSPDGKYNVSDVCGDRDDVDAYPHIYRISDQKKMTEWTNMILKKSGQWPPPESNRPSLSFQFFCEKLKAAVFSANDKNFVFDLSKGAVIGEFAGLIRGTNPDGSLVLINPTKPDNARQIDQSKVEILNLLDLIQPKPGP